MPVDFVDSSAALNIVFALAGGPVGQLVVTPNVDHFLRWQKSAPFRALYESASLSLLDGQPLVWLATLEGIRTASRVTGADLIIRAMGRAAEERVPVAIIGGAPGIAEKAALNLVAQHPSLRIILAEGPSAEEVADERYVERLAAVLRAHPTKIVALCLGSPKQEALFQRLAPLGDGGVYMGVGAAVDFLAGNVKRAPTWMQKSGSEWLFRLSQEPRRLWRRYLVDDIAVLKYFMKALINPPPGKSNAESDLSGSR